MEAAALAAQVIDTLHGQATFAPLPDPEIGRELVLVDLIQRARSRMPI